MGLHLALYHCPVTTLSQLFYCSAEPHSTRVIYRVEGVEVKRKRSLWFCRHTEARKSQYADAKTGPGLQIPAQQGNRMLRDELLSRSITKTRANPCVRQDYLAGAG